MITSVTTVASATAMIKFAFIPTTKVVYSAGTFVLLAHGFVLTAHKLLFYNLFLKILIFAEIFTLGIYLAFII